MTTAGPDGGRRLLHLVELAFDQSGDASEPRKVEARAFLTQLRESTDGWKVCLRTLAEVPQAPEEAKFWFLDVLAHAVQHRYASMAVGDKNALRQGAMAYLRDVVPRVPLSHAVKNKLALVFVRVVVVDYPHEWSSFFHDFLGLLSAGPQVVDVFLRVLRTIDEDIVEFDDRRTREEIERNMRIKDEMRRSAMGDIVTLLHGVISSCQASQPQLAVRCLLTLKEYISWIDINLVVNDRFLPLFYSLLTKPQLGPSATDCVTSCIQKRMDASLKFDLICRLKPLDVVGAIDVARCDFEQAVALSRLANAIGVNLIDCVVDGSLQRRAADALARTHTAVELALRFFSHAEWHVSLEVIPFLGGYVQLLKNDTRPAPSAAARDWFVEAVLGVILPQMRYPDDSFHLSVPDDDRNKTFNMYRNELTTMLRNLFSLAPDLTLRLLCVRAVAVARAGPQQPFADAEAVLHALYTVPEGVRDFVARMKQQQGPLNTMVGALFGSHVSRHTHPRVVKSYFELVVRFGKFFEVQPQTLVANLAAFMDERGIHHPEAAVRSRVCVLLHRLVKHMDINLKRQLAPVLETIIASVQSVVMPVLGRAQGANEGSKLVGFEDVSKLCGVLGVLVSSKVVGEERCRQYFSGIIGSMRQLLDTGLARSADWIARDPELSGKRFSQVINAMVSLSKDFKKDAPFVQAELAHALETVLRVLAALPLHDGVRQDTINFLHQMVACMPDTVLAFMPRALSVLLQHSTPENVEPFLALLNRVCVVFGECAGELMGALFAPVAQLVRSFLRAYEAQIDSTNADPRVVAAVSAVRHDRNRLERLYFAFYHAVLTCGLAPVLAQPQNEPWLRDVLRAILAQCGDAERLNDAKFCLSVVRQTVTNAHALLTGDVRDLVIRQGTVAVFSLATNPRFDAELDATAHICLGEAVAMLAAFLRVFREHAYGNLLAQFLQQQLGWSAQQVQAFGDMLAAGRRDDAVQVVQRFAAATKATRRA